MKITVQSIHFNADRKLLTLIEKKVSKLDTFFDRVISCEVFLRLVKADDSANKVTEIKLNIPGNILFAKEQCKSFEEGADLTVESMIKQLKKYNRKLKNHAKEPAKEIMVNLLQEQE